MIPARGGATGRPRVSSRRTIEEAAAELFLERGYDGTTVDDIARRAGVGRATFFNYFPSKPDLLWVDVDEALSRLQEALEAVGSDGGLDAVIGALEAVGGELGPDRIPLAVLQSDVMGGAAETAAAGFARAARLTGMLQRAVTAAVPGADPVGRASAASALAGAAVSAWYGWAAAGVRRGPIAPYLSRALAVVRGGVDAAFGRLPGG
ncbi:TetR family transcriptional regulator [Lysobacter korlensis]|uniref:TetR family transcriptional regulator n=1 Tax=Lysobacter korlensis TaxID=553636 RepID=A0ABV6RR07_9GAMM